MPTITLKNIPDELYEQLKAAAKANRRSINSQVLVCIERSLGGRPLEPAETLRRARSLREMTGAYLIDDETFTQAKNEGRL